MALNFRGDENIKMAKYYFSFVKYSRQNFKFCFNIENYTKYARYFYKF